MRESEYDSAAKSGNIFSGAFARFNGYFKEGGGFLPDTVKQDFLSILNSKLAVQTNLYNNYADETRAIAKRQQLNPDNVVVNFKAADNTSDPYAGKIDSFGTQNPVYQSTISKAKTDNPTWGPEKLYTYLQGVIPNFK